MLTAGLGAVVAVVMSWVSVVLVGGERPAWAAALQMLGVQIALAFVPAALAASTIMPRVDDLSRPIAQDGRPQRSPALMLLLVALALMALLQVPSLAAWWTEDRALLSPVIGGSPDPLGLNLIPQVILFSLPALAGAALAVFVLTSILVTLVRAEFAFSSLAACVVLQAGLVIGLLLIVRAVGDVGGTIQGLVAASPDANASAQVAQWFARHDAASTDVTWRLVWILGGYVVAAAASELASPRRRRPSGSEVALPGPAALPASPTPTSARAAPASSAATAFDQSSYAVRPRQTLLGLALRRYSEYDIQSIPPMSRARFSFAWSTGRLRREPDGPDLLVLTPGDRLSLLRARSYLVHDAATGTPIGTLRPRGPDWDMLDANGTLAARVVGEKTGIGFRCYVARAGDDVVCRFTWALQGLSVASAGLELEFLRGLDAGFDRALAVALAPILEHRARRAAGRG
jgi:hypothetical protein